MRIAALDQNRSEGRLPALLGRAKLVAAQGHDRQLRAGARPSRRSRSRPLAAAARQAEAGQGNR